MGMRNQRCPGASCDLIKDTKQSIFNFTHFLGFFGAYSYVEGTEKNTTLTVGSMKIIIKFVDT